MKVHRPQPDIWLQKGRQIKSCDNYGMSCITKQCFEMGETRITKPGATAQPVRAQLPLFFFLDFKRQAEHGIEHLEHGRQGAHARTQTTAWQAGVRTPAPSSRLSQSPSASAPPLQQRRQRIAAAGFPARRPASFDTHVRKGREKGGTWIERRGWHQNVNGGARM